MAELGEQKAAGCVAFTDDGRPVATALLMRRALEYAGMLGVPDHRPLRGSVAQGGRRRARGLHRGAARAARHSRRRRVDHGRARHLAGGARPAGSCTCRAHERAAVAPRGPRRQGRAACHVTCEVAPHHFVLTDEALDGAVSYDTNVKMNPPLREAADRDAMLDGHRRRHRRRDRHRSRAAPRRREAGRVRSRAVRHRRARDRVPLVFDRLVHAGRIGVVTR